MCIYKSKRESHTHTPMDSLPTRAIFTARGLFPRSRPSRVHASLQSGHIPFPRSRTSGVPDFPVLRCKSPRKFPLQWRPAECLTCRLCIIPNWHVSVNHAQITRPSLSWEKAVSSRPRFGILGRGAVFLGSFCLLMIVV